MALIQGSTGFRVRPRAHSALTRIGRGAGIAIAAGCAVGGARVGARACGREQERLCYCSDQPCQRHSQPVLLLVKYETTQALASSAVSALFPPVNLPTALALPTSPSLRTRAYIQQAQIALIPERTAISLARLATVHPPQPGQHTYVLRRYVGGNLPALSKATCLLRQRNSDCRPPYHDATKLAVRAPPATKPATL